LLFVSSVSGFGPEGQCRAERRFVRVKFQGHENQTWRADNNSKPPHQQAKAHRESQCIRFVASAGVRAAIGTEAFTVPPI
jgi:hypothetical protein